MRSNKKVVKKYTEDCGCRKFNIYANISNKEFENV